MSGLERLTPSLDRERHVDVLEPEAVDIEAARLLSDGDFAELGIPAGSRCKILAAEGVCRRGPSWRKRFLTTDEAQAASGGNPLVLIVNNAHAPWTICQPWRTRFDGKVPPPEQAMLTCQRRGRTWVRGGHDKE